VIREALSGEIGLFVLDDVKLIPLEQGGAEGQVAGEGGGGEEGFALVEGHEQQVCLAGLVPEVAFAVDPGDVVR
jgi:hypothetical protein